MVAVGYGARKGDWRSSLNGYRVVVLVDRVGHLRALRTEPGSRVAFHDGELAVVERR